MTDATATLNDVTSCDGRVFYSGYYQRIIGGVRIDVAAVVATCALAATLVGAAAWIIDTALSSKQHSDARASVAPRALAVAKYRPVLAGAADESAPARVSTAAADASVISFEARWAGATAFTPARAVPIVPLLAFERADYVPPPPLALAQAAKATGAAVAVLPASSTQPLPPKRRREWANRVPAPASTAKKRVAPQQSHTMAMALPDPASRTAVYDIAAHTVYLPNGDRLEAHSGLGDKLDDPRYINVRMRGPTPPNVYDLALREPLFHGVRAIRLKPIDDSKMFGRDGMLAHTYMLGSNGQSNGCVSFKDYRKFLQAFLKGEIARLVVVRSLADMPSHTARAPGGDARQYAFNNR